MRYVRQALILALFAVLCVGTVSAQWRSTTGQPLPLPSSSPRGETRAGLPVTEDGGSFIHVSSPGTISSNETVIASEVPASNASPMTDSNPAAVIFATHNVSASTTVQTLPFGIYYWGPWALFNQDSSTFPTGVGFNIQVQGKSDSVFVHTATAENIDDALPQITIIDHPLLNGDSDGSEIISIMPLWQGVYLDKHVGVYYDVGSGKWTIATEDASPMPEGAAFNVQVVRNSQTGFRHRAEAATIVETSKTVLDHPLLNNNPTAQMIVTRNWTYGGVYNNNPIGVEYDGTSGRWRIVLTNGAAMPVGAGFNIQVTYGSSSGYGDGVLVNGGFEAPAPEGKSIAIKWNSAAAGAGSKRVCNKYAPKSAATKIYSLTGECAFQMVGVPGELRTLVQNVPVASHLTGNGMDTFVHLKAYGVTGLKVKAKITLDTLAKVKFSLPGAELNGNYDWKLVSNGISLPVGTVATNFKLSFLYNGSGKVFIDSVSAANFTVTR